MLWKDPREIIEDMDEEEREEFLEYFRENYGYLDDLEEELIRDGYDPDEAAELAAFERGVKLATALEDWLEDE